MVTGDKKAGGGHGDKEGEFDSSHIVMKRWAEFERERRWKSGSQSRDSTFYDPRSGSPKRSVIALLSVNFWNTDISLLDLKVYATQPVH